MKTSLKIPIAIAAAALLGSAAPVMAQDAEYREHNLTVVLCVSWEGDTFESSKGNTFVEQSPIVWLRYSNREILRALVEEGVISSISGYSIVLYSNLFSGESETVALVKSGQAPIDISDWLDLETEECLVGYRTKSVEKSNSWVSTTNYNSKCIAFLFVDAMGVFFDARGILNSEGVYRFEEDEFDYYESDTMGKFDLSCLVGSGSNDVDFLLEGSVKGSAGKNMSPDFELPDIFPNND